MNKIQNFIYFIIILGISINKLMHLFGFPSSLYSSLKRVIIVIREQLIDNFVIYNLGLDHIERGLLFNLCLIIIIIYF